MTGIKDFAVKFGRNPDMGLEGQKAFPFIYSFVNHNDDAGDPPTVACIGPTVAASSSITHNVLLDPDYNFKLLSIKYSVYYSNRGNMEWYENCGASNSDGMNPDMNVTGSSLLRYISMTLSFQGSGSTILYGGQNTQAMLSGNGSSRIPLPVETIQGYDYGFLTLRTPYLLPRQGHMVFEISNTNTLLPLTVAAAIYGMKIRL